MNSVDRHLGAETKAATLLAMRSAKRDILLVVEGDTDVDLFALTLEVPRSNILSCNGKEILMLVYEMGPAKGIDPGSIFIRDRDHDSVVTNVNNGVMILVSNRYDIEMDLLANRIFGRILCEYLKDPLDQSKINYEFAKLCGLSAYIGALRLYSHMNSTGLDFDNIKYTRFIDQKTMRLNVVEMVRYLFAKSEKALANKNEVISDVEKIVGSRQDDDVCCSKEFIDIFSLALSKHYNSCVASECSPEVLSRTVRVAANNGDIKMMPIYADLKKHVNSNGLQWSGKTL